MTERLARILAAGREARTNARKSASGKKARAAMDRLTPERQRQMDPRKETKP